MASPAGSAGPAPPYAPYKGGLGGPAARPGVPGLPTDRAMMNMLYCQNMLTMCMVQLQQWESYRYQLALHLQGLFAAQPSLSSQLQAKGLMDPITATLIQAMVDDPRIAGATITRAIPIDAAEPAAPREARALRAEANELPREAPRLVGGDDALNGELNPPNDRMFIEIVFLVKGALFLLIFDCSPFALCVYASFACFYVAGVFDFVKHWFRAWGRRPVLEAQLVRLRREMAARDAAAARDGNADGARQRPDAFAQDRDNANGQFVHEGAAGAPGDVQGQPDQRPRPPYWVRWMYQLVFMFVMTMLPWWTPDEYYL